ncbi:ABC transporter substrate-binding protein [Vibrio sp. TH_r3]|uniref:ABC transporter substrate-binding protein n=1 Tax=Vibrio sp. TH_r3 TaxID=3082084 RepID=UPI0029545967|nr:ABC transporter substrate-binding protein [Vibrio sp. TH_r3]MDV7103596.1 ABC transporter substrate-binding protein [Vibrio sp. TH_r3]
MKRTVPVLALLASFGAQAEECGSVTIADMNWNSASLIANIDRFILEHGFDCDAEIIPGDNVPTTTSMIEKGKPDIAPEAWTNAIKDSIDAGVEEGRIKLVGKALLEGGQEGFWVPGFLVEQYPELSTIEGVKQHPELFPHPEKPDVGALYGCPAGWRCQTTNSQLFIALGLEEAGFELVDPGSSAGLSGSLTKALEREQGWFGYYWTPTPVMGKYNMVNVDFGTGIDEDEYFNCLTQEDCENPKASMYPRSPAYTIVTTSFSQSHPTVEKYLAKRGFTTKDLSKLLAWMEDEQAGAEDAMYYFLNNYPEIWKQWLSESVAEKVSNQL